MIQLHCPIDDKRKTQWFAKQSSVATNRLKGFCTVKKTIIIEAIVGILSLWAASGFAAINPGVVVTTLPDPDGDGAYVFGNANYTTGNFFDDQLSAGLAYPVWSDIGVSAGSRVKFVGGVALSSLPAGCTFDFSGATHVFATDAAVFGSGFTVPEGVTLLFQPCTVAVSGTTATFTLSSRAGRIDVPFEVDGTLTVGRNADIAFGGAVTGSDQSRIALNGYDRRVVFYGLLDFGGKMTLGTSQRNERIVVYSIEPESRIGTVEGHDWGNSDGSKEPPQLLFLPASATLCTLVVSNFVQHEAGGLVDASAGSGRYRRWGVLMSTCSNNMVRVGNVAYHGAVHLVAASNGAYTCGNEPTFDEGFANFEFVHLGNDNGRANRRSEFYPSPNVNLSITGRFTGFDTIAPSFDYTAESNAVNRGLLDMSQGEVYWHSRPSIAVRGFSPWNLPRSVKCHRSLLDRTTVSVADTRWLMPLDFGAETNEIDVARCETDAIISIPASGTVVVSNATTTAGVRPIAGRYPVITGNSVVNLDGVTGAEAFANWTVEPLGRWGGCLVLLDKTDTGLWMVVKQSGMAIRLR